MQESRKTDKRSKTQKRLYSVEDAAVYLGRTAHAVRSLCYSGRLPAVKIDGRVFFDVYDMDALIERSKVSFEY